MKLMTKVTALIILLIYVQVSGQVSRNDGMVDLANDMSNTLVEQIPFNPITTEGSHFYSDNWGTGEIELNNGSFIKGYSFKYDIENNELRLTTKAGEKILSGYRVKRFTMIIDNLPLNFVKAEAFTLDGTPITGFFEVHTNGRFKLFSKWSISIQKATYNVAIDMGTEENVISKIETLFLAEERRLTEVSKNKKRTLAFFGSSSNTIEHYAKENRLGFKKTGHLKKIVEYYNTL